ncbi:MAG TPA: hypothetical protein VEZ89_02890, partial [Rubrivivax sp.]|nr:hypothetical protein [Rubrivivax sp.]
PLATPCWNGCLPDAADAVPIGSAAASTAAAPPDRRRKPRRVVVPAVRDGGFEGRPMGENSGALERSR